MLSPASVTPLMEANLLTLIILIVILLLTIVAITVLKISPIYSLTLGSILGGLVAGLPTDQIVPVVITGFGHTIGSIGIVILFGTSIGVILEQTGGAIVIANTILKAVGKRNAALAMMLAGYVVSIPVFSDTSIVILSPVARTVSARSGRPQIAVLGALNAGIMATHTIVPPTPGPLAAAQTLGVDLGMMIVLGLIVAMAYSVFALIYVSSRPLVKMFPHASKVEGVEEALGADFEIKSDKKLPHPIMAFLCLIVPLLLICANSFRVQLGLPEVIYPVLGFLGHPVVALFLGVVMCFFLNTKLFSKTQVAEWFQKSIDVSSFIILATGASGSFGWLLRATGVGEFMGHGIANSPLPVIFVPFLVTLMLVLSNGSATVSLIIGSGIMLPLLPYLGLSPVMVALSLTAGASFFYHVNATHFWVVVKSANLTMKEGFFNVGGGTAVGSIGAMVAVFILHFFF
jgi:GntP family gluconate:H+ symporter